MIDLAWNVRRNSVAAGVPVRFIVNWPGTIAARKTFSEPESSLDMTPTFNALTNGRKRAQTDARSRSLSFCWLGFKISECKRIYMEKISRSSLENKI